MKKKICFVFILFLLSCGKKNQIYELKMSPVINLVGEKVEAILPRCYEAGVLIDSFLVLKENCSDTLFYLFSTNSYREISRFGSKGRGVCEFYYPFFVSNQFAYDSLMIYDSPAGSLTKIDLQGLANNCDITKCTSSDDLFRDLNFLYNFNIVDSAFVVTSIENDDGLFWCYNRNNRKIKNIEYNPCYFYEKGRKEAYCHHVLASEKDNSILVAFKYMNLINCYDLEGNLKTTYSLDWIKEDINSHIYVDENTILTFYKVYATRERCYLVWNGHKMEDNSRKYPSKIVVMNWQEKLEKVYELNDFVDFIIPDENLKVIYGGVFSPQSEVTEIRKYPML